MPAVDLAPGREKKQKMVFAALGRVTGVRVRTLDELEDAWMDMLS